MHNIFNNEELELITADLQQVTSDLQSSLEQGEAQNNLTENGIKLQELARQCQGTYHKLKQTLHKVEINGKHRLRKSFHAALVATWNENEVVLLEEKIKEYRQELILRILMSFR